MCIVHADTRHPPVTLTPSNANIYKAEYLGWRAVVEGKHPESAYFTYYSRELGAKTIFCMRRIADNGIYKPYAIITQEMFDAEVRNLQKGTPF